MAPAATIARIPARHRHRPAPAIRHRGQHQALSRTVLRVAAALAGVALAVFLVAVIALRYAVFPQIERFRDDIAASVSRASGMAVSLADVDAGWQGLRPILGLTGMRVADRSGVPVFALDRAEIALSWWTLLAGELRFHDVDLYRPAIEPAPRRRRAHLPRRQAAQRTRARRRTALRRLAARPAAPRHPRRDAPVGGRVRRRAARAVAPGRDRDAQGRAPPPGGHQCHAAPGHRRPDRPARRPAPSRSRRGVAGAGTIYAETGRADVARLRSTCPCPKRCGPPRAPFAPGSISSPGGSARSPRT
ncbi:MAG: hypothetical protein IPH30_11810 [Betaproteobacteria bacterium]|nr:hypothetical protein [Betaproteobacteria bacterium]